MGTGRTLVGMILAVAIIGFSWYRMAQFPFTPWFFNIIFVIVIIVVLFQGIKSILRGY
ncbi:MAG: hypothetical protein PVF58_07630 [Candidatus Methanofastidiosia archaeon]|jgi:hypothetical protein